MRIGDLGFPRLDEIGATDGFLQVLVDRFEAEARGDGIALSLHVTADAPALTSAAAKRRVREAVDPEVGAAWTRGVAGVRAHGGSFAAGGPGFALRHASAGAIVTTASGDVVLFLRDVHPAGWNIANGASASVAELADVESVMARELAEELLFVDGDRLLVLGGTERDEIAATVAAWSSALGLGAVERLPVDWLEGPDSLAVTMPDGETTVTEGLHLDVCVEAPGIECARVAVVEVPRTAVPIDGELHGGRLLDRPVGLFAVDELANERPAPRRLYRGGASLGGTPANPLCPITRRLAGVL